MEASIHEQLLALSEPEFQKFSSSLLPGTSNILGVRLPILRKLAKKNNQGRLARLSCQCAGSIL